nr:MAG TPA: hypothetical protein [Caudoviricetes sp.]
MSCNLMIFRRFKSCQGLVMIGIHVSYGVSTPI